MFSSKLLVINNFSNKWFSSIFFYVLCFEPYCFIFSLFFNKIVIKKCFL